MSSGSRSQCSFPAGHAPAADSGRLPAVLRDGHDAMTWAPGVRAARPARCSPRPVNQAVGSARRLTTSDRTNDAPALLGAVFPPQVVELVQQFAEWVSA